MGATLLVAEQRQTYTLTDRATYLAFKDKLSLVPLVEGDPELRGRDVAVERLYRAAGQPSFAIPGPSQLVEPGLAGSHQRELGRDEEGVGQHQHDDRREADDDGRCPLVFHILKCNARAALARETR